MIIIEIESGKQLELPDWKDILDLQEEHAGDMRGLITQCGINYAPNINSLEKLKTVLLMLLHPLLMNLSPIERISFFNKPPIKEYLCTSAHVGFNEIAKIMGIKLDDTFLSYTYNRGVFDESRDGLDVDLYKKGEVTTFHVANGDTFTVAFGECRENIQPKMIGVKSYATGVVHHPLTKAVAFMQEERIVLSSIPPLATIINELVKSYNRNPVERLVYTIINIGNDNLVSAAIAVNTNGDISILCIDPQNFEALEQTLEYAIKMVTLPEHRKPRIGVVLSENPQLSNSTGCGIVAALNTLFMMSTMCNSKTITDFVQNTIHRKTAFVCKIQGSKHSFVSVNNVLTFEYSKKRVFVPRQIDQYNSETKHTIKKLLHEKLSLENLYSRGIISRTSFGAEAKKVKEQVDKEILKSSSVDEQSYLTREARQYIEHKAAKIVRDTYRSRDMTALIINKIELCERLRIEKLYEIIETIRTGDAETKLTALKKLEMAGKDKTLIPIITDALRVFVFDKDDSQLKSGAIEILYSLRFPENSPYVYSETIVKTLIARLEELDKLETPRFSTRFSTEMRLIVYILERLGLDIAIDPLLTKINHPNMGISCAAANCIIKLLKKNPHIDPKHAIECLISETGNYPIVATDEAICTSIKMYPNASLEYTALIDILLPKLDHENSHVMATAVNMLKELCPSVVVDILLDRLRIEVIERNVIYTLVDALGKLGRYEAFKPLLDMINSIGDDMKFLLLEALYKIIVKNPSDNFEMAIKPLNECITNNKNLKICSVAHKILIMLGEEEISDNHLIQDLIGNNYHLITDLEEMGVDTKSIGIDIRSIILNGHLSYKNRLMNRVSYDGWVACKILHNLRYMVLAGNISPLMRAIDVLSDGDESAQYAALECINDMISERKIPADCTKIVQSIETILNNSSKRVWWAAIKALGRMKVPMAIENLSSILSKKQKTEEDLSHAREAAEILGISKDLYINALISKYIGVENPKLSVELKCKVAKTLSEAGLVHKAVQFVLPMLFVGDKNTFETAEKTLISIFDKNPYMKPEILVMYIEIIDKFNSPIFTNAIKDIIIKRSQKLIIGSFSSKIQSHLPYLPGKTQGDISGKIIEYAVGKNKDKEPQI